MNPARPDLMDRMRAFGLPVRSMKELRAAAAELAPSMPELELTGRVVAVVEYRDGSVIDLVRAI